MQTKDIPSANEVDCLSESEREISGSQDRGDSEIEGVSSRRGDRQPAARSSKRKKEWLCVNKEQDHF